MPASSYIPLSWLQVISLAHTYTREDSHAPACTQTHMHIYANGCTLAHKLTHTHSYMYTYTNKHPYVLK